MQRRTIDDESSSGVTNISLENGGSDERPGGECFKNSNQIVEVSGFQKKNIPIQRRSLKSFAKLRKFEVDKEEI